MKITFDGRAKYPLSKNKKDFYHFGHYKAPLLLYNLLQNWGNGRSKNSSLPELTGEMLVLDGHMYYSKAEWDLIVQKTIEAVEQKNMRYFEDFFISSKELTDAYASFLQAGNPDKIGGIPKKSIEDGLYGVFEGYHLMEFPWLYVLTMAQGIEDWLKPRVSSDVLNLFFIPEKPTILAEYQHELHALSDAINNAGLSKELKELSAKEFVESVQAQYPDIYNQIDVIFKKYVWIGMMHFWGEYNTREKIVDSTREINTGATSSFSVDHGLDRIPEEYRWLAELTKKMTYYRQYFAELCAVCSYRLWQIFKEADISSDLALWLTPVELFTYLSSGRTVLPSETLIAERKKGYGLYDTVISGKELQEKLDIFIDKVGAMAELRGTIASKGKGKAVTGTVTIVLSPEDVYKMKEGNILVSHETTPDFMAAIQRAAAIVTDIGGLTSHAAIVSRELNKPCIIGTKIGSRVLKDGDRVEVDANNGVVRILK